MTTLTGRELNQETGRAKRAAEHGPVFITDRGRPRYVLLSIEEYRRLTGPGRNIADLLAMPSAEDIDLEPPSLRNLSDVADLS